MLGRRLLGGAMALALLTGGLVLPGAGLGQGVQTARADDTSDQKKQVDKEIAQLAEDLAGTSKALRDAYAKLSTAKANLSAATMKLRKAEAAVRVAAREDAALATRLAAARSAEAAALAELAKSEGELSGVKRATGQLAVQVYSNNGMSPQLSLLLGAQSPDELASNSALVEYVMQLQHNTVGMLEQEQAGTSTARDRLVAVRAKIDLLKKQAAAHLLVTKGARAEAARQRATVADLVKKQAAAVNAIKAHKAEETAKLADLKKEQAKLTAELAARARSASGPNVTVGNTGGLLNSPVPGAPITSGFGMRMHPIYHYLRLHAGTDFGVACGTAVYAAADGTIFSAGWGGGYGNRIMIDHGFINGADMVTTYNHLSSFVLTGGRVNRGQMIGYSGTTGSSTGCHLHFEVRLNGVPVDPMRFL